MNTVVKVGPATISVKAEMIAPKLSTQFNSAMILQLNGSWAFLDTAVPFIGAQSISSIAPDFVNGGKATLIAA